MATLPALPPDPTLAAIYTTLVERQGKGWRSYLGASQIGGPCDRALWYSFRWALESQLDANSLCRITDGHIGEQLMAERLRLVSGLQLWTVDEDTGQQFSFEDLNGHFAGHLDGVILGLLQAPKTAHVWEHKQVSDAKFRELVKLKQQTPDEKTILEKWDERYFVQAQVYMHYLSLTRHYLTVATPGGRQCISVRTTYQSDVALKAAARAAAVITAARPPLRISENPADWRCKACNFWDICHSNKAPAVNCRTCAHSTATIDKAPWVCEYHHRDLEFQYGCDQHIYHPDLLARQAEVVKVDQKANTISYRTKDGKCFENGPLPALSSVQLRERLASVPDATIQRLAEMMNMDAQRLAAGELTENDWPRLVDAASQIQDESVSQALDIIDTAYQVYSQKVS